MDLYGGVRITNTYFSGHWRAVLPTLIRSVSSICRNDRSVDYYYIGIASGADYWQALKRRIDEKKRERGVSVMYLLYRSNSEAYTRKVEGELLKFFRNIRPDERVWNSVAGGGGRRGAGPEYFVYLAVTRSPF